jgi:hypothetical protein
MLFNRKVQIMSRHIFLLPILSISFLLFVFFYFFNTPSNLSIFIDLLQQDVIKQNLIKTNLSEIRKTGEPIIFSKSVYLNQTRKVKFSSFDFFFNTNFVLIVAE